MIRSKLSKLVVILSFALIGLGAFHGSASASADGDLDITTLPPKLQWVINPGDVRVQADQLDPGIFVQGR